MAQAAQQRRARDRHVPRVGRPPGRNGEETICRLVEAAVVNFGDRGYAGARMTEIAAAAGITHSSIYQYFTSKKELYRAAFEAAHAELLPEYVAAIQKQTPSRGRSGPSSRRRHWYTNGIRRSHLFSRQFPSSYAGIPNCWRRSRRRAAR